MRTAACCPATNAKRSGTTARRERRCGSGRRASNRGWTCEGRAGKPNNTRPRHAGRLPLQRSVGAGCWNAYDMDRQPPAYRLVRRPVRAAEAPVLDRSQAWVVGHSGGPLLVLAGPGTGKTTPIVETIVDRIARRGPDPARVLVLTFSRKAAQELRARITLRLNRPTTAPPPLTFPTYPS